MAYGINQGGAPVAGDPNAPDLINTPSGNTFAGDLMELHGRLMQKIQDWADNTYEGRMMMLRDVEYYHNKQWSQEEKAELLRRGQPVITDNMIFDKVNFVEGDEDSNRTDPRAIERTPNHEVDASVAEDAMTSEEERLDLDHEQMAVFESVYRAGQGGIVWGFDSRLDEITAIHVPWDRLIVDPAARLGNAEDSRFNAIVQWRYLEDVKKEPIYRGKEMILEAASKQDGLGEPTTQDRPWTSFSSPDRVKMYEVYFMDLNKKAEFVWFFCQMTSAEPFLINPIEVPFRTDRGLPWCPLQICRGYIDENNNSYGYIRNMVSGQDEINKRRSKFLHQSLTEQTAYEESAIENAQEFSNERAKPDAMLKVRNNALKDGRVMFLDSQKTLDSQFQLYLDAKNSLNSKGPHAALVNAEIRDISARSFLAQQEAGTKELGGIRKNIRRFRVANYKALFWMIRKYKTRPWLLRVTDSREGSVRFLPVNRTMTRGQRVGEMITLEGADPMEAVGLVGGPDFANLFVQIQQNLMERGQQQRLAQVKANGQDPGQPDPQQITQIALQLLLQTPKGQEMFKDRDLARLNVDITIDLSPESAVVEHAEFEIIGELMRHGVQIPPEVLVQYSRLRDKRKILAAMKPSPQQQQQQQMQIQLQIAQLKATVDKLIADASLKSANAELSQVKTQVLAQSAQVDVPATQADTSLTMAKTETEIAKAGTEHAKAMKLSAEAGAVMGDSGQPDNSASTP